MADFQNSSALTFKDKLTGLLEHKPVVYQFLRFACIGFLNTGLNFLIYNSLSKALHISQGWQLGVIAGVGFVFAVVQSYLWNRVWTFGNEQGVSLWNNIVRLFTVGFLGGLAVVFVFIASSPQVSAPYWFYALVLVVYLIVETVLWRRFGFHIADFHHETHSFAVFFVVTLIGLLLNSTLVSIISTHLHITNSDLDKNIAAALATGVALFWNFTGYKIIVFKK